MLQKINERIQGVISWVVIILVALTFTLFGLDYYFQSHQTSTVAADVNGQPIPKRWVDVAYQRLRQGLDPAEINAIPENQLKQKILDDIIVRQLSIASADQHGFEVSPVQAEQAIMNIPEFQKDGKFSSDRYQQVLSNALFTPQTFQEEVRQGMILNQQRFAMMGTTFVLPNEMNQFVKFYAQARDYRYIKIPVSNFLSSVQISDKEIQAYYEAHRNEFNTPKQVVIDYIDLSMADVRKKVHPSEESILRYYEDNQNDYLKPAEWKVQRLTWLLPEGSSDADIGRIKLKAKQVYKTLQNKPDQFEAYSQSLALENVGSVAVAQLPWTVAGASTLDKTFSKFTSVGTLLPPIESSNSIDIYKLIDFRPATVKSFVDVKQDIEEQLITEISQTNYAQQLELLTDQSYQSPDALAPIAASLGLPVKHSSSFSMKGGDQKITQNPLVIQAAFSHDVMALENNSAPIQIDNDTVIVLRLAQVIPAQLKPLAEVSKTIKQMLTLNSAKTMVLDIGQTILSLKSPEETGLFLQKNHLSWVYVKDLTHDSESPVPSVNDLAFSIPRMGDRAGREIDEAYVVVELNAINNGKLSALDKEQVLNISQQIEANSGMLDYDLYINQLVSSAKIEKHTG